LVVGVSLGNEMEFFHRHTPAELTALLDRLHAELRRTRVPDLPLGTTEPFHVFYEPSAQPLLARLDFLLANVHPIFQPWFAGASAADTAQFVVNVVDRLAETYHGPILVKETGVPTAPAGKGFSEERQAAFYVELQRRLPPSQDRAFAYFAAFDAPWRLQETGAAAEEAHWGLYDERRQPKPVVASVTLLASSSH
jgi:exo-beta-1,3-glucanase (GH17 family)